MNMRRLLLIARRDFVGYIKTPGFWVTFLSPLIGIGFVLLFSVILSETEPVRNVAIIDETGQFETLISEELQNFEDEAAERAVNTAARFALSREEHEKLGDILDDEGYDAGLAYFKETAPVAAEGFEKPEFKVRIVDLKETDLTFVLNQLEQDVPVRSNLGPVKLTGLLHVHSDDDGQVRSDYWTRQANESTLQTAADRVYRDENIRKLLEGAGLSRSEVDSVSRQAVKSSRFDPARRNASDTSASESTALEQMIPYMVGGAFGFILWFSVFSGSYMLLMSLVEEKVNKILEMVLASTRFSEVMFGKLLGVAALTLASMLPWSLLSIGGLLAVQQSLDPEIMNMITAAITPKILFFFVIYFILGYIFYGALFMALGSLAESMQDTQTLVTPVMLLLTCCAMLIPTGITTPDSALIDIAIWIPFSAPFAAIVSLPSDPPLWKIVGPVIVLSVSTVFVVWLAAKLFRLGAISGLGLGGIKARIGKMFGKGAA